MEINKIKFDRTDQTTWPPHCTDIVGFSSSIGLFVGEAQISEADSPCPVFYNWNERHGNAEDADYCRVANVVWWVAANELTESENNVSRI